MICWSRARAPGSAYAQAFADEVAEHCAVPDIGGGIMRGLSWEHSGRREDAHGVGWGDAAEEHACWLKVEHPQLWGGLRRGPEATASVQDA